MTLTKEQADGITWISSQSLVQLRHDASKIELYSQKVHAKQGGAYLSSFKGRGMEFDESRIYLPGDDIRNMDWRVTARTGTAHTKIYQEERERPVLLWLDLNPSMFFATRGAFKSVVATKAATLLAWRIAAHHDRIGGLIFSGLNHVELRPRRGKSAVLDFIGRTVNHPCWSNRDKESHSITGSISRLRKVTHPGSLIFMLSDFRNLDDVGISHLANIARHNDVVLIHVSDPLEETLPRSGIYSVTDGNDELMMNTGDKRFRRRYQDRYRQHQEALTRICRQHRMHLIHLSTDDDALESLRSGLSGVRNSSRQAKEN